jgi:ATP-dependent Clp protease ATP-binding subunit ClpA
MQTTSHIPLSDDAALVAALAGTAMAFSHCAEDEAERWLRALRLHGQVGHVLQAIGVGEAALERTEDACKDPQSTAPLGQDALDRTMREAERHAVAKGAETIGTADLFEALLDVYGELMDRALQARGSTRGEVLERLAELDGSSERLVSPRAPREIAADARAPRSGGGS